MRFFRTSVLILFASLLGAFCARQPAENAVIGKAAPVEYFRNLDIAGTEQIVIEEEVFSSEDWKACMQTNIDYIKWLREAVK